jgi:hypothetical protein
MGCHRKTLGNTTKEKYYQQFAEKLKTTFNKKLLQVAFGMMRRNAMCIGEIKTVPYMATI